MFLKKFFILSILAYTLLTGNIINSNNDKNFLFYSIPTITSPQQVFWLDLDNIVLVKDMDIYLFNVNTQTLEKISEREKNEFVGFNSNKELIICNFEHSIINSYEDFSTKLTFLNSKREIINSIDIFETVRPIFLYEDTVIVKNALDFLEEIYFEINIYTGEKRKIDKPKLKNFKLREDFSRGFWIGNMVVLEQKDGRLILVQHIDNYGFSKYN